MDQLASFLNLKANGYTFMFLVIFTTGNNLFDVLFPSLDDSSPNMGSKGKEFLLVDLTHTYLQIRRGIKDNSKIFCLLLDENMLCPSLELSHQEDSNDGSQHTF